MVNAYLYLVRELLIVVISPLRAYDVNIVIKMAAPMESLYDNLIDELLYVMCY